MCYFFIYFIVCFFLCYFFSYFIVFIFFYLCTLLCLKFFCYFFIYFLWSLIFFGVISSFTSLCLIYYSSIYFIVSFFVSFLCLLRYVCLFRLFFQLLLICRGAGCYRCVVIPVDRHSQQLVQIIFQLFLRRWKHIRESGRCDRYQWLAVELCGRGLSWRTFRLDTWSSRTSSSFPPRGRSGIRRTSLLVTGFLTVWLKTEN